FGAKCGRQEGEVGEPSIGVGAQSRRTSDRQRKPRDEPWSCGTNPRIRARSTVVHASCRPHWALIQPSIACKRQDKSTCLGLDITDIRARIIHEVAQLEA